MSSAALRLIACPQQPAAVWISPETLSVSGLYVPEHTQEPVTNAASLLIPANPSPPITAASARSARKSSLTRDAPERRRVTWHGPKPLSERLESDVCFTLDLTCSLLPRLSLITAPSSPRLSVLITANPSPHWTATHLWRPQRNPEQTGAPFIPTTYIYFALFPGFCLQ